MYKLLIADDNLLIRNQLRNFIDWDKYEIEVVALCSDGEEALEYITSNPVDIVISDVQMPDIDGNELHSRVVSQNLDVIFLFISSYDEYTYVKKALDNGAYGYVLKPLDKNEMETKISKIVSELRKKQQEIAELEENNRTLREQAFKALIYKTESPEKIMTMFERLNLSLSKDCTVMTAKFIYKNTIKISLLDLELKSDESQTDFLVPIQLSKNELLIVGVSDKSGQNFGIIDEFKRIYHDIEDESGGDVYIGVSESITGFTKISLTYEQAVRACEYGLLIKRKEVFYNDIEQNPLAEYAEFNILNIKKEVMELLANQNKDLIDAFLTKYIGRFISQRSELKHISILLANGIEMAVNEMMIKTEAYFEYSKVWKKIEKLESIPDVRLWFYNILNGLMQISALANAEKENNQVNQIKEYIEQNFASRLTVKSIAKQFYMSETKLNMMFKQYMNVGIFDYIIDYRISKAEELLKQPDSKIYVVVRSVGFTNQAHFSVLFKNKTGLTPNEYKKIYSN